MNMCMAAHVVRMLLSSGRGGGAKLHRFED